MSSLALPREAARDRGPRGLARAIPQVAGADALLLVAALVLATVLVIELPSEFNIDSWLALITGREIWQTGIPHHETLIALAYGHRWVDQQWLSQLASYGIYLVGGFGLLGVVNVVLLMAGVAGAMVAARHQGAPLLAVLLTLPLCAVLIIPWREVRTQTFVVPLFVSVSYLLARDARAPSRRVLWCLPLLVVWANLHGSVTVGAGLVVLHGLTLVYEQRRTWRRALILVIGAPLSILITPYGVAMIGYYRTTLASSALRHAVSEWQPLTTRPFLMVVLFILAGVAVWSFVRFRTRTTLWQRIALLALAAAAVFTLRNSLFFALFALMVLPVAVSRATPVATYRGRSRGSAPAGRQAVLNRALVACAAVAFLLSATVTVGRPSSYIEFHLQRAGVLRAVRRAVARYPSLHVMADERAADWLLWRDPGLDGHIAYDARFEMLSPSQLDGVRRLMTGTAIDWKRAADGDGLLVLDRRYEPQTVNGFLAEPGRRVLYDDGQAVVILRGDTETGRG